MGGSVGAYVHISRISDERVEHVDKSYKAGQKVCASPPLKLLCFFLSVNILEPEVCCVNIGIFVFNLCRLHSSDR